MFLRLLAVVNLKKNPELSELRSNIIALVVCIIILYRFWIQQPTPTCYTWFSRHTVVKEPALPWINKGNGISSSQNCHFSKTNLFDLCKSFDVINFWPYKERHFNIYIYIRVFIFFSTELCYTNVEKYSAFEIAYCIEKFLQF